MADIARAPGMPGSQQDSPLAPLIGPFLPALTVLMCFAFDKCWLFSPLQSLTADGDTPWQQIATVPVLALFVFVLAFTGAHAEIVRWYHRTISLMFVTLVIPFLVNSIPQYHQPVIGLFTCLFWYGGMLYYYVLSGLRLERAMGCGFFAR